VQKLQGEIHSAKPAKLACFDLEGFNFPGSHTEHCLELCSDLFIETTHFHSPYIVIECFIPNKIPQNPPPTNKPKTQSPPDHNINHLLGILSLSLSL
jgi:hypothetical protein